VIDKDLASERLAEDLDADALLVLTPSSRSASITQANEKRLSTVSVAKPSSTLPKGILRRSMLLKFRLQSSLQAARPAPRNHYLAG
jgi:carbamate kinase